MERCQTCGADLAAGEKHDPSKHSVTGRGAVTMPKPGAGSGEQS